MNKLILILMIICQPVLLMAKRTLDFKRDFGAKGNGYTDDSKAWSDAIKYLNKVRGGVDLYIPRGTYIIGSQTKGKGGQFAKETYKSTLVGVNNLAIYGEVDKNGNPVSIFKYKDGLYYGHFDKKGKRAKRPSKASSATLGSFIIVGWNCSGIQMRNLELDGNLTNHKVGFVRGDLHHIGIYAAGKDIYLDNIYVHHFALDGIYIQTPNTFVNNRYNAVIHNTRSEYNGRQGLSFTRGEGLWVKDSKFRYTGLAGIAISPGANIDIENHDRMKRPLRNILIENCDLSETLNNNGAVNIAGKSGRIHFLNCKIHTSSLVAINNAYTYNKDFIFENCDIKGMIELGLVVKSKVPNERTLFKNCIIKENGHANPKKHALINVIDDVVFQNCNFYINPKRKFITGNSPEELKPSTNKVNMFNAKFYSILNNQRLNK